MRVSDNGRYLVRDDGTPFFYLADTAWSLFYDVTLEEAEHYLRVRAEQGFTVIMPVLVWDEAGRNGRYGRRPFLDLDPARPDEAFWAHVDQVVALANDLGLTVALLPTGDTMSLLPGEARRRSFRQRMRGPMVCSWDSATVNGM